MGNPMRRSLSVRMQTAPVAGVGAHLLLRLLALHLLLLQLDAHELLLLLAAKQLRTQDVDLLLHVHAEPAADSCTSVSCKSRDDGNQKQCGETVRGTRAIHAPEPASPHPLSAKRRLSSSISLVCRFSTAASDSTSLTIALLITRLARHAKRSVLWLSSTWQSAGVIAQMMAVFALPPSEGWRIRVSLLSR